MLFACSKSESDLPTDDGQVMDESFEKAMTVTTDEATFVTSATATCGGIIQTSGGGGNVTERGMCYDTSPNPKITDFTVPSGSGNGRFTSILSGLSGSTLYYAKAYAIKNNGTVKYGNQVSFTTLTDYGTVTDADGNVYTTININNQVWTVENLKTTTYRDGTQIENVTDNDLWASLSTGAYCNYNNDEANVATYGRPLYKTSLFKQIRDKGRWWAAYSPGGAPVNYFYMQKQGTAVMGSMSADSGYPGYYPFNQCNGYSIRLVKD